MGKKSLLFEAATKGCVRSLQQLLIEDPLILNRVSSYCCLDTCLHVAAKLGHIDFVNEILKMRPDLTKELNSQGSSPLHLASAEGHVEVVSTLLSVDREMCLVRDINGLAPIHLAAIGGRDEVIKVLVEVEVDAARLKLCRGETILHLCVKYNKLEALKLVTRTIRDPEFVNSRDEDGNTVLHLAVTKRQIETVNFLLTMAVPTLEVNAQNLHGVTAMDYVDQSEEGKIRQYLEDVGGVRAGEERESAEWEERDSTMVNIHYMGIIVFVALLIGHYSGLAVFTFKTAFQSIVGAFIILILVTVFGNFD